MLYLGIKRLVFIPHVSDGERQILSLDALPFGVPMGHKLYISISFNRSEYFFYKDLSKSPI